MFVINRHKVPFFFFENIYNAKYQKQILHQGLSIIFHHTIRRPTDDWLLFHISPQ